MNDRVKLNELAKRLYDLFDPWDRLDMTPADFAKVIQADPLGTIEHLLDTIDELRA